MALLWDFARANVRDTRRFIKDVQACLSQACRPVRAIAAATTKTTVLLSLLCYILEKEGRTQDIHVLLLIITSHVSINALWRIPSAIAHLREFDG